MTAGCVACGYNPSAVVTASWSFFVPHDVKSQNRLLSNSGAGRFAYAADRNTWHRLLRNQIQLAARGLRIPDMPRVDLATNFRRVTLTRCYFGRQREFDSGNMVGGCKPILDAMVNCQMLGDDSSKHCQVHYKQERSQPTGMRFLVEELAVGR